MTSPSTILIVGGSGFVGTAVASRLARDGIRRMAEPSDIAELTVFLCSQKGRHIQGAAIPVDGGATPGFY